MNTSELKEIIDRNSAASDVENGVITVTALPYLATGASGQQVLLKAAALRALPEITERLLRYSRECAIAASVERPVAYSDRKDADLMARRAARDEFRAANRRMLSDLRYALTGGEFDTPEYTHLVLAEAMEWDKHCKATGKPEAEILVG